MKSEASRSRNMKSGVRGKDRMRRSAVVMVTAENVGPSFSESSVLRFEEIVRWCCVGGSDETNDEEDRRNCRDYGYEYSEPADERFGVYVRQCECWHWNGMADISKGFGKEFGACLFGLRESGLCGGKLAL